MFCPKCKSIISKKRINNQIVEFCNCPDKLESKFISETIPEKKPVRRSSRKPSEGKVTNIKEQNKRKFTTIQESIFKPKREPSEYTKLPLELRISNNAHMSSFWKQEVVQKSLLKLTEETYERYYRRIEDYFVGTGLRFFISFLPNDTLTEFSVDHWGLAFNDPNFTVFYAGTKLNDLGSFDSRVLEKKSDLILPNRLFPSYNRTLNFDHLTLGQLLDVLKSDWTKYKEIHHESHFESTSLNEIYANFKNIVFS